MRSTRARSLAAVAASATVIGLTGCTSDGETAPLSGDAYVTAMDQICGDTETRLAELPDPPEGISATDWAAEVSLAFAAESQRAADLVIESAIGTDHRTFVTTTDDLAAQYSLLSETVESDPDSVGAISTEITELSLGRDDIADELGLSTCVRGAS